MGRRVRSLTLTLAAVALVAVTGWLLFAVWRSPHRDDLATFGAFAIPVVVIAAGLVGRTWQKKSSRGGIAVEEAELNHLADLLAIAVTDQWTCAAGERGLLEPEPIAVQWMQPSAPLSGPVSAAVESRRFAPLPGLSAVGHRQLIAGGLGDLHTVYGGLGSGRLVIAGAPGAGKSGAAVLLILTALRHREQFGGCDQAKVPVPVMFTFQDWNPEGQLLRDWLTTSVQQTYPFLAGSQGAIRAAALLAAGKISVFLDGLDEIPQKLRAVALRALSQQATFRLVLLTRSAEMADAAYHTLLDGAAAIELQDTTAAAAADYLTRVQLDPAPRGWRELTSRLRRAPRSPIAQALSSPLTLTLVRDTYRSGDDVRELLDFCDADSHRASREDVLDYLLDRVLPSAYRPRPGQPSGPYDLKTARDALCYIAAQMNQRGTRDLRWWRIPAWVPAAPRRLVTGFGAGLATGLAAGLPVGLAHGLTSGVTAGLVGLVAGSVYGFMVSSLWSRTLPRRMASLRWRELFHPISLAVGVVFGVGFGLANALAGGTAYGLALGVLACLTAWAVLGFSWGFSQPGVGARSPFSPLTSWRGDRMHGLVFGLVFGLMMGIQIGLMSALKDGLGRGFTVGVSAGLAACFAIWLTFGLTRASTWPACLAFAQLAVRGHTPARLIRFLEDARARSILRTIGPVYQFRHARLQDRLAGVSGPTDSMVSAPPPSRV